MPFNQLEIQWVQESKPIEKLSFAHKVSTTANKIMAINPHLILGESNLFQYDVNDQVIKLSVPFQELLKLLVHLTELDPEVLNVSSLTDLNTILQKQQGPQGGLLRKEGVERWELGDNSTNQQHRKEIDYLLKQLGFVSPQAIDTQIKVDHCILFGARAERMEKRILETLKYLKNNLEVTGHIFLLGSNRKLIPEEMTYLKSKLETMEDDSRKSYWNQVFDCQSSEATEADAFMCLWECLVPSGLQTKWNQKLIGLKSTRIGPSYQGKLGYRVTTEVTVEDLMPFYNEKEPQAIFALIEQPYIRLLDQLRFTVVSNAKKALGEELIERIQKATFHFCVAESSSPPLLSVLLDEIARNVYRVNDNIKYYDP